MADYRRLTRQAARRYGLDPHIFERQIGQESGFNPNARSGAGAQGIAQIMPATARGWGVDPNNPKAALNAAAKHMAQYVRKFGSYENALRAYNAGPGAIKQSRGFAETNAYVAKILGGRDPKKLGTATPGGGGADQGAGGATPGAGNLPQGSEGLVPLLAALSAQKAPAPSGSLQAPAVSAAPAMPVGLQTPVSGGGPAPKPDLAPLLEAIQTIGGDVEHAPGTTGATGGSTGGSTGGAVSGGMASPASGKIIGTPYVGTHTLGNWQSDRAVDVALTPGTPVRAARGGRVVKVNRAHEGDTGRFGGIAVTIEAPGGGFFYGHLRSSRVKAGDKIKAGDIIGGSGVANGVAHLHFGVQNRDPRKFLGRR